MEAIDKLGTLIYEESLHRGYLMKWNDIKWACKTWVRNREVDMERVREMKDFHEKGGYIPRIIHLAYILGEGLVCYDGNHRRHVFNDDKEIVCIVDIMFNASQEDVYKAFDNINKAVQVPALYFEEYSMEHDYKDEILKLVKSYEVKFKPFLSTSSKCHAPNFNRDSFVDNIHKIYKAFNSSVSITTIAKVLDILNVEYSQGRICRPHSSYNEKVVDKCKKHNLWLFIDREIPTSHVESVLKYAYV